MENITATQFSHEITKAFGDRTADVYFHATQTSYYADYRPNYPEKTAGDVLISYNHITGKLEMSTETATTPITREFSSFAEVLEAIKGMDY